MAEKEGMLRYNDETKKMIIEAYHKGASITGLNQQYGINRYAIQSWCEPRKKVELNRRRLRYQRHARSHRNRLSNDCK